MAVQFVIWNAEVAQLVELQPSKLNVAGSSPVFRSKRNDELRITNEKWQVNPFIIRHSLFVIRIANVAQLVEHIHGKDEVTSSILVIGS